MSSRGRGSKTALERIRGFLSRSSHPIVTHSPPDSDATPPGSSSSGSRRPSSDTMDLGGSSSGRGSCSSRCDMTDTRILLHEVSNNLFPVEATVNASKVSQVITASFKKYVHPEGVAWRFVSDSYKNTYWEEFKKSFRWEMPLTDERAFELWTNRAMTRYKDWVNLVKKKRPTKGRPDYMDVSTWDYWTSFWDREDVKEKSVKARQNRLSEPDGPGTGAARHRGGSRSAVAYSMDLAREQGLTLGQTVVPTFKKLHYSHAEAAYTSWKAKHIAEEYEAQVAALSQGLPEGAEPSPDDHAGIFVGVAQDPAKQHVFGIGSLYRPTPHSHLYTSQPSTVPAGPSQAEFDEMQARLIRETEARENVEGRLASVEAQLASWREEYAAEKARDRELMERLLRPSDTPDY